MKLSTEGRLRLAARSMLFAVGVGAASLSGVAYAQSNVEGAIYGTVPGGDDGTIVIENTATGATFTSTGGDDGRFRFSALPTGSYKVTLKREGKPDVSKIVSVRIGTGTSVSFETSTNADLGTVQVVGAAISPIDVTSTDTTINFSEEQIDQLPIARNLTAVALLAPGTTLGDSAFGNLASFSGSSVGENVYYFNGFNISNFRTGLGFSVIPFEFIREFQVNSAGYGAEFGRSTGGLVNMTSKSGGNEFKVGANIYWEPESLRSYAPSSIYTDEDSGDRVYLVNNDNDEFEERTVNLFASGPIVKDRLFFYAIGELRDRPETYTLAGGTVGGDQQVFDRERDTPFYGVKLDGVIADGHNLEFTYIKNEDEVTDTTNNGLDSRVYNLGGKVIIGRYSGKLLDNLTLSLLAGKSEDEDSSTIGSPATSTYISATNIGGGIIGFSPLSLIDTNLDERKAYRADLVWETQDHRLRVGYDLENNSVDNRDYIPGNYMDPSTGDTARLVYFNRAQYEDGSFDRAVYTDFYENIGAFETDSSAYYIEDTWYVDDRLVLTLGLRNETFDNKNAKGDTFIKTKDQLQPRLGLSYDLSGGEGTKKLLLKYGRYYIPVATNTNLRLAGAETYIRRRYDVDDANPYDENGLPNFVDATPMPYSTSVYGDGSVHPTESAVDSTIEPQYQDEFVIGYQQAIGNKWQVGLTFIHRDLKSTLEDIAIDAALNEYAAGNGYDDFYASGFDYYVLTNPGSDLNIQVDLDGDEVAEDVAISGAQTGYPKGERYYNGLEFTFEKIWDGKWTVQGSYTWSQSYGNVEGYVRSDNGQDDAGLTTGFDQPGLVDGSYGYLPNDRRHRFKAFGAYRVLPELDIGANLLVQSGRPINAFGNHPSDAFAAEYGSESFYSYGELNPRASRGETPWIWSLDLSARYKPMVVPGLTVGLDVINVFDNDDETEVFEIEEQDFGPGVPDYRYNNPTAYQTPRYVRLSLEYDFTF